MRVAGKMAFVTGGASGLGRASSLMLAKEGAKVAVSDVNAEGAKVVADEINALYPGQGYAYRLDVTNEAQWKEALSAAHEDMGGFNVLLNNAGIGGGSTIEDTDFETWKRVHEVDTDSVFLGCKYAIPLMQDHAPGSIINISSIAGLIAGHNMAAYNSAKAGVWLLSNPWRYTAPIVAIKSVLIRSTQPSLTHRFSIRWPNISAAMSCEKNWRGRYR